MAALIRIEQTFDDLLTRRAEGDWSPDPALAKFSKLPEPAAKPQTTELKSVNPSSRIRGFYGSPLIVYQ